jgi:hypothetical protein
MATARPAIIEYDVSAAEMEISAAWCAYQQTEHYGLEFGRVCCEWRDKFGAQGSRTGKGLAQILRKLDPPCKEGKAYYWINEYEALAKVWSRDKEKRKNRPEPVKDFEELRTLAIKMLNASYKEFKSTGNYDNSHLHAAKEWARLTLEAAE